MITLAKTVKLPLKSCRGTYQNRIKLARKLNDKFYQNLKTKFNGKNISVKTFTNTLNSILKGEILFRISDSSKYPFVGLTCLSTNPKNKKLIDRYKIFLPLNPYDKSISMNDTDLFMHETFHLFCEITNPKHLRNTIKMGETNLFKKTQKFYSEHIYSKNKTKENKFSNKILLKFLNNLSDTEKITFLQNCRYRLKEENNAYKEGRKYYKKIQEYHSELYPEKFDCSNEKEYNFTKKIRIIETQLKNILLNLRKQNRCKTSPQNNTV